MSDYKFLMESRLSPEQFRVLNWMSQLAAEQGLNLYLVGGAVRDLTFGQQIVRDLDVAVEGNPRRILRHLSSGGPAQPAEPGSRLSTSEPSPLGVEYQRYDGRLNSADLRFTNGVRAELAMCRQEVYTKPGQRPKAFPAMIFDDLKRRDFSVNAMAVSLHPNSRGLLLDPTNGAADIERRELRALHSRSFLEEPWRIYRLLRLGRRLGFKPEERTKNWLATALENRAWERLEPEQQGRELRAILQEENPPRALKLLAEQKLLAGLDAKLASTRIPYERFARIRAAVHDVPGADPFLLNFHALTEKLGRAQKIRLAKKVINESKAIRSVLGLEREAKKLAKALGSSKASLPSQVYALLSPQPLPLLLFLRVSSPSAKIQSRIKNYLFKYSQTRARLPRAELQALGVKPGAAFEKILERVFVEQLDGITKTHQQLIKRLRELAGIKEPPAKPAAKARAAAHPKPQGPPPSPGVAKKKPPTKPPRASKKRSPKRR
jgi:tRNA nucleotidyltransferase/poly(A) polymerase